LKGKDSKVDFFMLAINLNFVGGCFMHGHKFVKGKKQFAKVGKYMFISEVHLIFLDRGIKNQCYQIFVIIRFNKGGRN